jgi:hypothetical protein
MTSYQFASSVIPPRTSQVLLDAHVNALRSSLEQFLCLERFSVDYQELME